MFRYDEFIMDTGIYPLLSMAGSNPCRHNFNCYWNCIEGKGKVILLNFLDRILRRYCNLITWIGAVIFSILFWFVLYHGYMVIFGK